MDTIAILAILAIFISSIFLFWDWVERTFIKTKYTNEIISADELNELQKLQLEKLRKEKEEQINNKKLQKGCGYAILGFVILVTIGIIASTSNNNTPNGLSNTSQVSEKQIKEALVLRAMAFLGAAELSDEVAWYHVDGNSCYIGLKNTNKIMTKTICEVAAKQGNAATNFGFHVWACRASKYPTYSTLIMGKNGYIYATTCRYGEIE